MFVGGADGVSCPVWDRKQPNSIAWDDITARAKCTDCSTTNA